MKIAERGRIETAAKERLKKIKEAHPGIGVHLVYRFGGDLCRITEGSATLLRECRGLFLPSSDRDEAYEILRRKKTDRDMEQRAASLIEKLSLNPEALFELRWDDLNHEINGSLRSNARLVRVDLTPQVGGIRIVLGTLRDFY